MIRAALVLLCGCTWVVVDQAPHVGATVHDSTPAPGTTHGVILPGAVELTGYAAQPQQPLDFAAPGAEHGRRSDGGCKAALLNDATDNHPPVRDGVREGSNP